MAARINEKQHTFCNPINISYRYQEGYYGREAADPSVVLFRGEYYLFASHCEGYWFSTDLYDWNFVSIDPEIMPEIEKFAPTAYEYRDTLYLVHSENGSIFKSSDPKSGRWEYVGRPLDLADPMVFVDDDQRIYCYYGCSDKLPLYVAELDGENNMALIGVPKPCIYSNPEEHGFEVPGDSNTRYEGECWLEGAWAVKNEGKYYLQYAVPGTEYRTYADGCYVADSPMGPFVYCENSPVSCKATGYVTGAGHGSLIRDLKGNWWKFGTVSISVNHRFERRIVMTPARFNAYGELECNMSCADHPMFLPNESERPFESPGPGWNLLSFGCRTECSSFIPGHESANAVDENIRSWWSAESGSRGEYLILDLRSVCTVNGIAVNFADEQAENTGRREGSINYSYLLEYSMDGSCFKVLADCSKHERCGNFATDTSHDYYEVCEGTAIRYLRLTNMGNVPAGGKFAVSGLRVFGTAPGRKPAEVTDAEVTRDIADRRKVHLRWDPVEGADGYEIFYGIHADSLNITCRVFKTSEITLYNLNSGNTYFFVITAFNTCGLSEAGRIYSIL